MEIYSLLQDLRMERFLRWSYILDLRVIRAILLDDERSYFFLFFGISIRNLFLLFYQIFMPLRISKTPFHLVSSSPWPFYTAVAAFVLVLGFVQYMNHIVGGIFSLFFGFVYLLGVLACWWRDVIREASFQGMHTREVQKSIRLGIVLFIVSEVFFFITFFWAFFHSSLVPVIQTDLMWPPVAFDDMYLDWAGIPLLNTFLLLTSGLTITYAHASLIKGRHTIFFNNGLLLTLFLAIVFLSFQFFEYLTTTFDISDGVYGSTFYMTTGFHGFHVIVGTIFIAVAFFRRHQFTSKHHVGFEGAVWYWHFVDVVWLFLFLSVYWWATPVSG